MDKLLHKLVFYLILLAVAFLFCVLSYNRGFKAGKTAIKTQTDTLFVYDTITQIRPIYVQNRVVDTMFVAVADTTIIHDSIFVKLPIQERVYSDSTYYAVVSGYRPSLDTIRVYQRTEYIHTSSVIPAPRFGFGVMAGASLIVNPQGRVDCGFGVTCGLYYRF